MTSNDIKVGDRVTWKPRNRHKKHILEIMTGTVVSLHGGRKPWASVYVTVPREGNWCVDLHLLTRVTDTALAQAIAAQPFDDQAREDAIAPLRVPSVIEAVTDDYDEALRNANHLGLVEL